MTTKEEWFPVVDENGRMISKALRSECHNGKSKLLHPVVHLHLFNKNGELYLQKRAMTKDLLPGFWDTSVGGHVSPGESAEDALKRETVEELGLTGFEYRLLKKYIWESSRERELVYSFTAVFGNEPSVCKDEIDEGRFWTLKDIEISLGKNMFTPNFEHEFINLILNKQAV